MRSDLLVVVFLIFVTWHRGDWMRSAGVAGESWRPWDYCAGWLIIEEAGGVLMTLDWAATDSDESRRFYMYSKSILAASSFALGNELFRIVTRQER
jgi:3'-phosphoadenosine 5'-phosphosulfate (PAPS) 3'-phosphatase